MIYFVQDSGNNNIKIGSSINGAEGRLSALQTGNSRRLVVLGEIEGDKRLEHALHQRFADYCVNGEWFQPSPEVLSYIIQAVASRTGVTYKGKTFRCELDAQWAAFFDEVGASWAYQPKTFDLCRPTFVPEFWLPYHPQSFLGTGEDLSYPTGNPQVRGYWVVVRPNTPDEDDTRLCSELATHTGHCVYLLAGPVGADSGPQQREDGKFVTLWATADRLLAYKFSYTSGMPVAQATAPKSADDFFHYLMFALCPDADRQKQCLALREASRVARGLGFWDVPRNPSDRTLFW